MSENLTVGELLAKFDHYRRVPNTDSVLIHLGLSYNFIEFKEDFVNKLKQDLQKRIMMAEIGIDELGPVEAFIIEILKDSY